MISSLIKRYLPGGGAVGQFPTISEAGQVVWASSTPGGVVTENGANAANVIGATTGDNTAQKIWNLILSIAYRLEYLKSLDGGLPSTIYFSSVEGGDAPYRAPVDTITGVEMA